MYIGNAILKIRETNQLSQEDMANRLFVTRQAVSRWENNDTAPSIDILKLIIKEFNIDANFLLGVSDNMICQSCGMDLIDIDNFGKNNDNTIHTEYCKFCFDKGEFTHSRTLDEMIESNLKFLDEYNKSKGTNFTADEARVELKQHLKSLKRWK